jgi:hypothetical protein
MFLLFLGTYLGLLFPMLNQDRLLGPDPLDLSFVLYLNSYTYWIILGAIWAHEQLENKYKGTAFLKILPIKKSEIVTAKFSLVLLSVVVYVAAHLIWFSYNFDQPDYIAAARSNLIFNGNLCLIISALLCLGFCRFGYQKFGKYAIIIWLIFIISPLPVKIFLFPRLGITTADTVRFVTSVNPVLVTGIGLLLFFSLMRVSIRLYTYEL